MNAIFRYAAKIIQIIYGQTRYDAHLENGRNARIIRVATNISAISTTNAQPIMCAPKKAYDHNAFNTIWAKNNRYARPLDKRVFSFRMTKNNAIPSSAYKIAHANANTQPSGVTMDLFSILYHASDAPFGEYILPIAPGIKETIIAKIN